MKREVSRAMLMRTPSRRLAAQRLELGADGACHLHRVAARLAPHLERDALHAVQLGEGALVLDAVLDARDVGETRGCAVAEGDDDRAELAHALDFALGLDRELARGRPRPRGDRPAPRHARCASARIRSSMLSP